jgi:hypothetical protein
MTNEINGFIKLVGSTAKSRILNEFLEERCSRITVDYIARKNKFSPNHVRTIMNDLVAKEILTVNDEKPKKYILNKHSKDVSFLCGLWDSQIKGNTENYTIRYLGK